MVTSSSELLPSLSQPSMSSRSGFQPAIVETLTLMVMSHVLSWYMSDLFQARRWDAQLPAVASKPVVALRVDVDHEVAGPVRALGADLAGDTGQVLRPDVDDPYLGAGDEVDHVLSALVVLHPLAPRHCSFDDRVQAFVPVPSCDVVED